MAPCSWGFATAPAWHLDAARGPSTPSFDHLVSAEHKTGGHVVSNRLSGLEVNHKLERGGLLDRQIGRLRAAEYFGDHTGALTKNVNDARTIAEQAALFGRFGPLIDRRQAQFRGTLDDDAAVEEQHWRRQHVERTCATRARIVHRRH